MPSNPRIDDLRKRLEKDPGSRLFAQLAEELRKAGDLDDAVRVSRDGLAKHPAYPSARLTLGRALLDQGQVAAAKAEFAEVLKTAADNILASRFLGECLEAEGDHSGALARYEQTLLLSPGDAAVEARRQVVLEHLAEASRLAKVRAVGESLIPVSETDEEMEVVPGHEAAAALPSAPTGDRPAVSGAEPPPIPLAEVDEEFELERPYDAPAVRWEPDKGAPPADEAVFEFEDAVTDASVKPPDQPMTQPEGELASPTLAELYFSQGFTEKALEVYRQLLERDPANARVAARLAEIENLVGKEPASDGRQEPHQARAVRREAVQRTIGRLERLLVATRREAP